MAAVTARSVRAEGSGQSTGTADDLASESASASHRRHEEKIIASPSAPPPHPSDRPTSAQPVVPPTPVGDQPGRGLTTLNLPDAPLPAVAHPGGGPPEDTPPVATPPADRRPDSRVGPLTVHWTPALRTNIIRQSQVTSQVVGVHAWPVGFSPIGDLLPATLPEVLRRGSHAVRSANEVEEQRKERADAIATYAVAQIAEFLAICAAEGLTPTLTIRVVADRQPDQPPDQPAEAATPRRGRRTPPRAWPVLYWRNQSFPYTGRSLHLFVDASGQTFESREDPGPQAVLGRDVRVWPVDVHTVIGSMAEVDARRCAHQLVYAMAHLLWNAGISL
ncbi:hypothetical protein, partial [Frankia sp. Cr1]|uniref:hypothetical protein n=1 Tax=Frankia sp. Cr1 TaxID=3073931 RepID=UPI002AD3119C